ncbi:MAG: DUF4625 domain-containing protein [Bacteroidales bacterium]|jgi:hypothetical protein|nr:DUF4625 domain-containing protein [Bacteroidales bacterium]
MKKIAILPLSLIIFGTACSSDNDNVDSTLPTICEAGEQTCPTDCYECLRGESIDFCYTFTDDIELGNFNIEIHNNFDHHTHSTSSVECELNEKKSAVNAWVYNQDYSIPDGLTTYTPNISIVIPTNIDTGDYHFMIRLTDKAGWQQLRSVAIKVVG